MPGAGAVLRWGATLGTTSGVRPTARPSSVTAAPCGRESTASEPGAVAAPTAGLHLTPGVIDRLAQQVVQSIETSSLHLDLISDLKRINSHICSIAYPILESAGALTEVE